MYRRQDFAKVLVVYLTGIVCADAAAQQDKAVPPEQGRLGAAPPGTHGVPGDPPVLRRGEIEPFISPAERERLGMAEPTWVAQYGKVHPDVRAVLETGEMPWLRFKGWEPMGFEGTAYVEVHLKCDALDGRSSSVDKQTAIESTQSRVLSRLTAAEFSARYLFKNHAGLIGYVNTSGLEKLAMDGDVVAIALDDKPVPEGSPPALGTPRDHRDPDRWTLAKGKVDPQVQVALESSTDGYVFVLVVLRSVPRGTGTWQEELKQSRAAERELEYRVLSDLSASEFRVQTRDGVVIGYVNVKGLAKLNDHADVVGVGLQHVEKLQG